MYDELFNNETIYIEIIKIIIFFDLFSFPLTAYEIWHNLGKKIKLTQLLNILEQENNIFSQQQGFYFLLGRGDLVALRQRRYNYSQRKLKIARHFSRLFSLFPTIKMVALANSIGQHNLRDGSDIDFFIITSPGLIWLSRLYCTGLAKILHSRPNLETKKDKICLSFYLSADHLDIDNLRLSQNDPYFDYWRRNLVPLFDKEEIYENFLRANKIGKYKHCFYKNDKLQFCRDKKTIFVNYFEKIAKKIQLKILPAGLTRSMNNSDGVVINDRVLKLYQRDRRHDYAQKYVKKIKQILKENN